MWRLQRRTRPCNRRGMWQLDPFSSWCLLPPLFIMPTHTQLAFFSPLTKKTCKYYWDCNRANRGPFTWHVGACPNDQCWGKQVFIYKIATSGAPGALLLWALFFPETQHFPHSPPGYKQKPSPVVPHILILNWLHSFPSPLGSTFMGFKLAILPQQLSFRIWGTLSSASM